MWVGASGEVLWSESVQAILTVLDYRASQGGPATLAYLGGRLWQDVWHWDLGQVLEREL